MRLFNGKPLYHHVLLTLDKCEEIEQIIINTDSDVISDEACKLSAKVKIHIRPKEICGDFVPMNDIIAYDIKTSGKENFIQTHSTNPLLKSETLSKAFQKYKENIVNYDSVFSVTRLQTRLYWQDGKPVNHNPAELLRTQDLPPLFEENSNFFIFSDKSFIAAGNKRIGLKPLMFEMNKLEATDIDEPADFILAETLHKLGIV